MWAGKLDRAREVLRSEYEELARQGSMLRLPLVLLPALVDLEWRAGRWVAADAYGEEARAILDDALPGGAHVLFFARFSLRARWVAWTRRGGSPPTVSALRAVHRSAELRAHQLGDRARRTGSRRPGGRCGSSRACPRRSTYSGSPSPAGTRSCRTSSKRCVARPAGRGRERAPQLEAQAAALRHPWASAAALRCRAVLLLGREHADEAARPNTPPPSSRGSASRSTAPARSSPRVPPDAAPGSAAGPPTRSAGDRDPHRARRTALARTCRGRAPACEPAPSPRPRADGRRTPRRSTCRGGHDKP